jgi:hypothetical protein
VVLVVWAAAQVGAVVLAAWGVVLEDKTLVVSAQEPQHGMSHSLPLAQSGQPRHRSHRREGCASQAPSSVDRLSSAMLLFLFPAREMPATHHWCLCRDVPLALMASGGQAPVQVVGCTNKGQVSEGLGEVSQVFTSKAEFLSV